MATFTVGNQFAAKPLGAYLLAVSAAFPFGFDAARRLAQAAEEVTHGPSRDRRFRGAGSG